MTLRRLRFLGFLAVVTGLVTGCARDVSGRVGEIYERKADPTEENLTRIREMLNDPDRDVRATALNAMVSLDVPDSEALAVGGLADPDGFVRATAAKLVADVDNPANAGLLAKRLFEDSDPIVRQRAAEALARLGGELAVLGLIDGILDPQKQVRLAAVRGVRQLDPGSAKSAMSRIVLEDAEWEIRVQAARALGASGDPDLAPVLEAALEDPNEFVRSAAAHALRALGSVGDSTAELTDGARWAQQR